MRKFSSKKGSNIAEYALVAALVGIVAGLALFRIDPKTILDYFSLTFGNSTHSGSNITIRPIE